MSVLKLNDISKIYNSENFCPVVALDKMNFIINNGEFVGIMGPSGSGKTTLLNLVSGIDTPTSGNIEIKEKKLDSFNANQLAIFRRQSLGFVFQDFNLMESLTIKENVALPMILEKKNINEIEKQTKKLLKMLDLYDISDKYPYQISGGQQQRTTIGRALVNNPSIVLADEPTGNLDSSSSNNVMSYFEKINKENNVTILLVTHDSFAASFCQKIIFVKDGKFNSELNKNGSRKEFFDKIHEHLSMIGDKKK